jgi:hypothetical protein
MTYRTGNENFYVDLSTGIQVMVFFVTTLFSNVVGHQCFGGPCCLCLHHITTWRHNQEDHELNLYRHENLKFHISNSGSQKVKVIESKFLKI